MAKKKFIINSNLAQALGDTVTAAQTHSGNLRVEIIPLSKIELDPENPREFLISMEEAQNGVSKGDPNYQDKQLEIKSLESLVHSINEQGILNPVIVYKYENKYRLVAGERRTLASLIAKKPDIHARILDSKPSSLQLRLIQWVENNEREDLSLWERISNLHKITLAYCEYNNKPFEKISGTDIKQLIGCSSQLALNYKLIFDTSDELKQAIKENRVKNLDKAAFIAKTETTLHAMLIKSCEAGASLKTMKAVVHSKKTPKAKTSKVGRQATKVTLGQTTSVKTAKFIFDSIFQNSQFNHLQNEFNDVIWDDYQSINKAFEKLLSFIENSI